MILLPFRIKLFKCPVTRDGEVKDEVSGEHVTLAVSDFMVLGLGLVACTKVKRTGNQRQDVVCAL